MQDEVLYLNFYGILVKIITNESECSLFIRSDFSYFYVSSSEIMGKPQLEIYVLFNQPPFNRIPAGTIASYHTKDAIIYKYRHITYYDSAGKALVIYDNQKNIAEIHSLHYDLLHEKTYLMIMSRIGELLDLKKLHRIHAMGVVYKGKAVLCLLPMGGGKTTLTLSLLENKSFSLLSEEVPLVSNEGYLYPFPIRMGVTKETAISIPGEYLKDFNRSHYEPKVLIDIQYFKDQIAVRAEPGFLFIGKRIYSDRPAVVKISRLKAFPSLFRLCVMGLGIPQLMEYILRFDFRDISRQLPLFISRLWASLLLLKRSKTYELHLGYDKNANACFVSEFVTQNMN